MGWFKTRKPRPTRDLLRDAGWAYWTYDHKLAGDLMKEIIKREVDTPVWQEANPDATLTAI